VTQNVLNRLVEKSVKGLRLLDFTKKHLKAIIKQDAA